MAFARARNRVAPVLQDPEQSLLLPVLVFAGAYAAMFPHELAHGLTTKHYQREIKGGGVGWYWFGPIAFVDSSDMWTAGRWPRVAVSLAGPCANLLLAAAASIGALVSPNLVVAAGLWQFALLSGIIALVNLNPLIEYDGYYILSDALDRPNLRQRSLEWLGQQFPRALRDARELRRHWFELLYGLLSIGFLGIIAVTTVVTCRIMLEVHLRKILPPAVAEGLPWVLAGLLVVAACTRIAEELRIIPSPKQGQ